MTKDELEAFCENQTLSQEDWFKYNGEIYFIQGFYISQENKMCLTLDNIASNKEVWINKVDYQEDDTQETNVKEFLKAPLFSGKTFMEIYPEVKWLYSDGDDDDNESQMTKNPD